MLRSVYVLQRSDTVGVVLKSDIKLIVVGKADKLAALPCKIVTTDLDGIADYIIIRVRLQRIFNINAVIICQQVAPACIAVGVGVGPFQRIGGIRCEHVGLLRQDIAGIVVFVNVGFVLEGIIFSFKLADGVIFISVQKRATVFSYLCDIPIAIVAIVIGRCLCLTVSELDLAFILAYKIG